MSYESMKKEAEARMGILTEKFGLKGELLEKLQDERIYYSRIEDDNGYVEDIDKVEKYVILSVTFEQEYNAFVYHALETKTPTDKFLTLLYVTDDSAREEGEESWDTVNRREN